MAPSTQNEVIQALVSNGRARSAAEFYAAGVNPAKLSAAVARGRVFQWARGVYCAPEIPHGMSYAATTLLNPGGVVCLQSAALIHCISDENPSSIWYALDRSKTRNRPKGTNREPLTVLFWSGQSMSLGVEQMMFAGVQVNVTNPARTVVDMLRRSIRTGAIGDEQPLRALRDFILAGGDLGDIWEVAKAFGCLDQFRPIIHVAEEMRTVMTMPRRG